MRSLTVNPKNIRKHSPDALNIANAALYEYNSIPTAPVSCNIPVIIRCELESPNLTNSERIPLVVRQVPPKIKNDIAINQRKSSNNVIG